MDFGSSIAQLGEVTAGGGFTLNNSDTSLTVGGAITTTDQAIDIDVGTGQYTQSTNIDVSAGTGAITIVADAISLGANDGNNALTATGGVTLRPSSASQQVNLGSTSTATSAFNLSDAEIDVINSATLTVGSTSSANVVVSGTITPETATTLSVLSGNSITDTATANLSVTNLRLEGGSVTLDSACLLYTSPSPRDVEESRMPSSA